MVYCGFKTTSLFAFFLLRVGEIGRTSSFIHYLNPVRQKSTKLENSNEEAGLEHVLPSDCDTHPVKGTGEESLSGHSPDCRFRRQQHGVQYDNKSSHQHFQGHKCHSNERAWNHHPDDYKFGPQHFQDDNSYNSECTYQQRDRHSPQTPQLQQEDFHSNWQLNDRFGRSQGWKKDPPTYRVNSCDEAMFVPPAKRGFHNFNEGTARGCSIGGSYAKLYVAFIPRTAIESDIQSLFEEYGSIVEVVLLKDKKTGQQHGSCFVKYATKEEADRAISGLHNQYTFDGEPLPLQIRYAANSGRDHPGPPGANVGRDCPGPRGAIGGRNCPPVANGRSDHPAHSGAKGRRDFPRPPGPHEYKLYVDFLNKQASKKEIEEVFSPYGVVEEVFLLQDEQRKSRGKGFIKFSHPDMALAAVHALDGNYIMKGCERPLIVRLADPKKPKSFESRTDSYNGSSWNHHPFSRNLVPSNSSGPIEPTWTAPMDWQFPSECTQSSQESSHDTQIQLYSENIEEQRLPGTAVQQTCETRSNATYSVTDLASPVPIATDIPDCDWSEHICPDGHKYYYNCETCESRWEKPREFIAWEELYNKKLERDRSAFSASSVSFALSA